MVLVAVALVAAMCSLLVSSEGDPGRVSDWFRPVAGGSGATYGDWCTDGVCVADLVSLPARQPVETAVDLAMPETVGALSVERLWTSEQAGLFGRGWASVWDIRLRGGRLEGPIPAVPTSRPKAGGDVSLADGSTIHLGGDGRVDEVCVDATACTTAERAGTTLRLRAADNATPSVVLKLSQGRVVSATTSTGRARSYRYADGLLREVIAGSRSTRYRYDAAGRLIAISDGADRRFTYAGGRVASMVDRGGGTWAITGGNDVYRVVDPNKAVRTYRFERGTLVKVDDDKLGVLLQRKVRDGSIDSEERPADRMRTERLAGRKVRVSQERPGAPPRVATLTVDAAGRVVRSVGTDGTTTVRYDGRSDRPATVDHNGTVTRFAYDGRGLLSSTVDADGYRVEIGRDASGQPLRISDGLLVSEFAYDGAGRVVEERSGSVRRAAGYRGDGLAKQISVDGGEPLGVAYDQTGRLTGLGTSTQDEFDDVEGSRSSSDFGGIRTEAPDVAVQSIEELDAGGSTYTYGSGDTATFDAEGRLTAVMVDQRTTTRRYDDAGRITEVSQPGEPTYQATYTRAGRLSSVSDGTVKATLKWHGDLLLEASTSTGSTYRYSYDSAGRLTKASVGALAWAYRYDPTGRLIHVDRPTGTSRYEWDEFNRPTLSSDGSTIETYAWSGDRSAIATVKRNGEPSLTIERDDGRVARAVGPDGATSFGYDQNGRLKTYQLPGSEQSTVSYDDQGRVTKLATGDHIERWSWSRGRIAKVTVDGDDEPYMLAWAAPGLLERVTNGDRTLMKATVDESGRITRITDGSTKGDPQRVANFSWSEAGLTDATINGWKLSAAFDAEHRPTSTEFGGQTARWTYEKGALETFRVGEATTGFDYDDGHLSTSTHQDRGEEADPATVIWNGNGARPTQVDTTEGPAKFRYDAQGRVTEVAYKNQERQVTYDDDRRPSADGAGGEILGDLFDARGRFNAAGTTAAAEPDSTWFDHLPSEIGIELPGVVTGDDIVHAAIDEALPAPPMPLTPDADGLAERTAAQVLALGATRTIPVGPDRSTELSPGRDGPGLDDLLSGSPTARAVRSVTDRLGPDPCLLCQGIDFGADLFGTIAGAGKAVYRFLSDTPIGRAVLQAAYLAIAFLPTLACGLSGVCDFAVGAALDALLAVASGGGVKDALTALTSAALAPLRTLEGVTSGDPVAIVTAAALTALAVGTFVLPGARLAANRLLPAACNLKRLVCISTSRFGPAADHVLDAQKGGAPRVLQIDRPGTASRRTSALRNIPTMPGLDRDEYPFAVSSRRAGLSIRHIDPASNRSLGAYLGRQISGLPDGARFYVLPIA